MPPSPGLTLESRVPDAPVYRLGRRPNAWSPPDWAHAHTDGTFGNRFDDPQAYYRVLYASSQRLSCFLETLARFRPDLTLLAELHEIEGDDDFNPPGSIPADWLGQRTMGTATIEGSYADIYAGEWIAYLRRELAATALLLGLDEIDASTLQSARPRALTQRASLIAFREGFDGIFYRSRYGDAYENWALFEPFPLRETTSSAIQANDPDLNEALRLHGLAMSMPTLVEPKLP